jgi:16S rRNA (cytosine967-C5)-methyltransferase
MSNARLTAARGLMEVFADGGYSNIVLNRRLEQEGLSPQDRAFCSALFYGVVERAQALDWAISQYSKIPPRKMEKEVLTVLRCGFYQLTSMPSVPPHAAVNESVTLIRKLGKPGAAGFVNGVLRAFQRAGCVVAEPKDRLKALSVQYSVPEELIRFWRKAYGHETMLQILEGTKGPAPMFLRCNPLKGTAEQLCVLLGQEGLQASLVEGVPGAVQLSDAPSGIAATQAFRDGWFHVQDLSSQICAMTLDAKPGMRVLDVCAAPGGKTFTIAEGMNNQGEVVACDLYPHRVELIEQGAKRLGLSCVHAETADAEQFQPERGLFDRVLCDVVCSGFGIMRRKPEIRYKKLDSLEGIGEIQYKILEESANYCKPGGKLLYSTCTLNPAENEQMVSRFLEAHPAFEKDGDWKTFIRGELDCDGFFCCLMNRKE